MSTAASPCEANAPEAGWAASLELGVGLRGGRSEVLRRVHRGPLNVQRPFYPPGDDRPHVYLLHPPGGLVGADRLTIQVEVDGGAAVLVTTPAATKVYRTGEGVGAASQTQVLRVRDGASAEWLPQETIVFRGARAQLRTRVDLAPSARFLGWEMVCLGRPASGEAFDAGACDLSVELWREGLPLFIDRTRVTGDGAMRTAAFGLAGCPVMGTMLASPAPPAACEEALQAAVLELPAPHRGSVSRLDGVLVARYLGPDAERGKALFVHLWSLLRPAILGRAPVAPRIWAT